MNLPSSVRSSTLLLALLSLACQAPQSDDESDTQQDESGVPSGDCASQSNAADCAAASDPEDTACQWFVGAEVELVGDQCQLGAEVGVCVKTAQGDDTCGAYAGLYAMEGENGTVVIDASPCEGVPGFVPCDTSEGPTELPAACECSL